MGRNTILSTTRSDSLSALLTLTTRFGIETSATPPSRQSTQVEDKPSLQYSKVAHESTPSRHIVLVVGEEHAVSIVLSLSY